VIEVGLLDDHPMVVEGIAAALASAPDVRLAAHGGTEGDARRLLTDESLDVCLLDVRLADGNGLQYLAERGWQNRPAVLAISTFAQPQYVAAAVRFGAAGYLPKTAPLQELLDAIRAVAGGQSIFTQAQLTVSFVTLTPKEREVVRLAIAGLSNKEIGAKLGTTAKTVEGHLTDLFGKHAISGGRIELAARAQAEGWLEIVAPRQGPRDALVAATPRPSPK